MLLDLYCYNERKEKNRFNVYLYAMVFTQQDKCILF